MKNNITAEDIKRAVNGQLSGYPWGGECVNVHKNQWSEWIADCHIWGVYYGDTHRQVAYWAGDPKCPVSQFMVEVYERWVLEDHPSVRLWKAQNDMRLPTFIEEMDDHLDEDAPPSPYIVEPIKAYIEAHKNDLNPF